MCMIISVLGLGLSTLSVSLPLEWFGGDVPILLSKCSGPRSLNGRDVIFYFNRTGYFLQGLPWVTWE